MKKNVINLVALYVLCINVSKLNATQEQIHESSTDINIKEHYTFITPITAYIASTQAEKKTKTLIRWENGISIDFSPTTIMVNHEENVANPFYNRPIGCLNTINYTPLLTTVNGSQVYYINRLSEQQTPISMLASLPLNDATLPEKSNDTKTNNRDSITSGIVGLTWCITGSSKETLTNYILAAVSPKNGQWGQEGSGIALIKFDSEEIQQPPSEDTKETTTTKRSILNNLDAVTGKDHGNRAYPIRQIASINDGLDSIFDSVNLYWDHEFERLYIPLKVKTRDCAHDNQGAHALLAAYVHDNKLAVYPVVPWQALSPSDNNIIAAVGPHRTVSLHHVRVMHTSTGLAYLIIVGGNGNPDETANKVYALPLVNKSYAHANPRAASYDKEHGAIANANEKPSAHFYAGKFMRFKGRVLEDPHHQMQNFYTDTQKSTALGGFTQLPGPVRDVMILQDCVYVLTQADEATQLLYSQALFDHNGLIVSWAPWRPVSGAQSNTVALSFNNYDTHCMFLDKEEDNLFTMRTKHWILNETSASTDNNYASTLISLTKKIFADTPGGIQSITDLSCSATQTFLAFAGYKKLMLFKGTTDKSPVLPELSDNGSLENINLSETQCIALAGGDLDQLGAITTACIAHNEQNSWLLVGGSGGLAILSKPNGSGWYRYADRTNNFSNFSNTMLFKKIGNYKFIKKIIYDDSYVYLVTHNTIERLSLKSETIKNDTVEHVTVASGNYLHTTFNDMLVSGPFAMLATADGLLRVGNNKDIRYAMSAQAINWTEVQLPYTQSSKCITSLYALSATINRNDFARDGQVYVLNSSITTDCADVYRLFVRDIVTSGINNNTISIVPDYSFQGQLGSFIAYGGYRNNYATDGLMHISCRGGNNPLLHVLPAFIGGKLVPSFKGYSVNIDYKSKHIIGTITKDHSTSNWLVAGDFGLCVYQ